MAEQDLACRARQGDKRAFARLVETYQAPIYNLCYRLLGEAGEAEDAAQESFIRAYTQLHRYDPARSFKTWLFAIAHHHCIDRLRKRRLLWVDIEDVCLATHPALHEATPGPEESAVRHEEAASIEALMRSLAPENRSVLVLRYWYGLSYEEIAQSTGYSVPAVKSRLHRARLAMAEMLSPKIAQMRTLTGRTCSHLPA